MKNENLKNWALAQLKKNIEMAGFKMEHQGSGKMFNTYYFVRKGGK